MINKKWPYSFKAVVDEIKIQRLYETKQKIDVNYLDGLGSGLLIRGKILQKSYPEYEDKYHGYPGWDKMTPEQKLQAMKQWEDKKKKIKKKIKKIYRKY